jgi:hypothetical protein
MTTPTKQFISMYESLLKKYPAKEAFEKASEMFQEKHDYELYSSYASFKAALSRSRAKQVNNVNHLSAAN